MPLFFIEIFMINLKKVAEKMICELPEQVTLN